MSDRKLRCYAYVNRPFEEVSKRLHDRTDDLFPKATSTAAARAGQVAANLRVKAGAIDVGVDVSIRIGTVREEEGHPGMSPIVRVPITWEAVRGAALFPAMSAELSVWPLSATETQVELDGTYNPPLGAVGGALDAVVGHRVAEAAVHRFLDDVVEGLRKG
jgi:hypothetical protein